MQISTYKISRGEYKIVVFKERTDTMPSTLETYKVKGKRNLKNKVALLEKLDSVDLMPRHFKVMKDGKVYLQFTDEESQLAAIKFCQKTDPKNKEKYTTT